MKKALLVSGILVLLVLNPLYSSAKNQRIRSKILKIEEIQEWLFKTVHERDDEQKVYDLVKILGIYQSGNYATIYYSYAVTDRSTGDRKVYRVATLNVIRFNHGEWFCPKGFARGNFLTK
jgi:hypothetical protein